MTPSAGPSPAAIGLAIDAGDGQPSPERQPAFHAYVEEVLAHARLANRHVRAVVAQDVWTVEWAAVGRHPHRRVSAVPRRVCRFAHGREIFRCAVEHTGAGLRELLALLGGHGVGEVAIERPTTPS